MTVRYLNELLAARCEDVLETIDEIKRVGARPPRGGDGVESVILCLQVACRDAVDMFKEVEDDGRE